MKPFSILLKQLAINLYRVQHFKVLIEIVEVIVPSEPLRPTMLSQYPKGGPLWNRLSVSQVLDQLNQRQQRVVRTRPTPDWMTDCRPTLS